MITYIRVRLLRWRTEANNGIGCLGRAVLSAAMVASSAALSGSLLAWPSLSNEVSRQGGGLHTLARCLPDPRAANRQENNDRDRAGQAAGHLLRVRSGLGWSKAHLQTHSAGQVSAPKLQLSDPDQAGLMAEGGPPSTDTVRDAV